MYIRFSILGYMYKLWLLKYIKMKEKNTYFCCSYVTSADAFLNINKIKSYATCGCSLNRSCYLRLQLRHLCSTITSLGLAAVTLLVTEIMSLMSAVTPIVLAAVVLLVLIAVTSLVLQLRYLRWLLLHHLCWLQLRHLCWLQLRHFCWLQLRHLYCSYATYVSCSYATCAAVAPLMFRVGKFVCVHVIFTKQLELFFGLSHPEPLRKSRHVCDEREKWVLKFHRKAIMDRH